MADFFKSLFDRFKAQGRSAASSPAVAMGVCGKHPSEGDHFCHYTPGADRLPELVRLLYTEGIKRCLESGAWEQLDPTKRLAHFDHLLLWRESDQTTVGRILPSADRVGRDRYPIIYAAECRHVGPIQAIQHVMPEVERVAQRCRDARSRSAIEVTMAHAQERLSSAVTASPDGVAASLRELLACAELGPNRQGIHRVLYRLQNEVPGCFAEGAQPAQRCTVASHLRVPRCAPSASESIERWSAFLGTLLTATAQFLLLAPVGHDWTDLIVGPIGPEHAFFLGSAGETLTTEIPYPLDPTFAARADALLGVSATAAEATRPAPADAAT